MFLSSAVLTFALVLQTPPTSLPPAADPAAAPVIAAPPSADAGDEIVCRSEIPTGRRVPVRVCRSRAQMRAEEAAGQEALRRAQERHRRSLSK